MSIKKPSWSSHFWTKSFATSVGDGLTTFLRDDFIVSLYHTKIPTVNNIRPTVQLRGSLTFRSMCTFIEQESLANARSARDSRVRMKTVFTISPLFDAPQLRNALRYLYIAEKYIQWGSIPSLTIRVYLHLFSCYCIRNTRNVTKFQKISTLQQFKVIQGHRSWCQWKTHM